VCISVAPPRWKAPQYTQPGADAPAEHPRRGADAGTAIGALSNVEQRVLAIRVIEQPQHRHLSRAGMLLATNGTIQAAFAQLRLAFRQQVAIAGVAVERSQDDGAER